MLKRPRITNTVTFAFAALTFLFVGATLAANWFSYEVELRTGSISSHALPSITHLTAACDALRELETISDDYDELPPTDRTTARLGIERSWRSIDRELTEYLSLSPYPGERALYNATIPPALRVLHASVAHLDDAVPADHPQLVRDAADTQLRAAADRAAQLLRDLVTLNATHAQEEVTRIEAVHQSASRRSLAMDGLAAALAIPLSLLVLRRFRAHDELVREHGALLEARAVELEMFGQRVAHDLLHPLTALTYCLGPFERAARNDPKLVAAAARARMCVTRAQSMVHGVFEFARAGGRPEPNSHTRVRSVIESVTEEVLSEEGGGRADVTVEPFEDAVVACTPAVLTLILSNLVRNATKFMGDCPLREITIRAVDVGGCVRVEVEDTGPGVPTSMEARIFEPYVRGEGVTQRGLGLGLATVKRLCEAYSGTVGVRSPLGRGAVFWFTLPKLPARGGVASAAPAAPLRAVS